MAGAEAEKEPRTEPRQQARASASYVSWILHPYIEHSGGDRNPPRCVQQVLDLGQHVAARIRNEDGRVPELLQFGRGTGTRTSIRVVSQLPAPDPDFSQVN